MQLKEIYDIHKDKLAKAFNRSTDSKGKHCCTLFATVIFLSLAGLLFSFWGLYQASQATEDIKILWFIVFIIVCLFGACSPGILLVLFFDSIVSARLSKERLEQEEVNPPASLSNF